MHRTIASTIVVAVLGLVVSSAQGQRGTWTEDRLAAPATGLACLQVDVFVVSGQKERLAELDGAEPPGAESAAELLLLQSLGRFGRTELIGRYDQVVDLVDEVAFTSAARVPVRGSRPVSSRRQRSVSISYEEVGCKGKLKGSWEDASNPPTAQVDADFEASWIVVDAESSGTEEERDEGGVPKAVAASARLHEELTLESGRPGVLVEASHQLRSMTTSGEPGIDVRFVVRLVLTRSEEAVAAAPAEAKKRTESGQTLVSVIMYEITGPRDKLLRLRPDEQIPPDLAEEDLLAKLKEYGEVKVVSRPSLLATWPQPAQVQFGERVPVPASAPGQSEEEAAEAVKYEEVGIKLSIDGEWLDEVDKKLAQVRCQLESSQLYAGQRRGADGPVTAAPRIVRTDRRYRGEVWEGEWTWLPRQARSTSGDREKLSYLLTRMRIQRVRAPGVQAPPESQVSANDDAAPGPVRLKVAAYEVRGNPKTIDAIDLRTLEGKESLPEILEVLPVVTSVGQLMDSEATLTGPESAKVTTEESEEGQVSFGLKGRWLEGTPRRARLEMDVRQSRVTASRLLGGQTTVKEYREDRARRTFTLESGRSMWLSSQDLGWQDPGEQNEEVQRLLVRLEAVAPESGQDPRSQARYAPQATRLNVELFDFQCPMQVLSKLEFAGLARRAQTTEQILAELKKIGKIEPARQFTTTVDDLREALHVTSGLRLPTVQDISISSSGQVTPSISYEEVGTILDVRGRWLPDHAVPTAVLNVSLEDSDKVDSPVAIPTGTRLPCFTQLKQEHTVLAVSGRPVIVAASGAEAVVDDDVRLALAVITVTREASGADDIGADRRERAEAGLARVSAVTQHARMRLDVFEVPIAKDAIAGLNASTLRMAGSREELLGSLQKLGQPSLRYCAERPVLLTEPVRLACGARVPTVRDVVRSARGQTTPSVSYQEVGYILELGGCWREDLTNTADLALEFECSGIESTSMQVAEGVKLPAFGQSKLSHQTRVRSGEPVILLATEMPVPGDTETLPRLMVFHLVVSRDEG